MTGRRGLLCKSAAMVLAAAISSAAWGAAPSFQGLGDLPGGSFCSQAYGVSADGSVIVGLGTSASGNEAFRWTLAGGMQGLGDLPGGNFRSSANGVSGDGSTVIGRSDYGVMVGGYPITGYHAFRWTTNEGMQSLGDLYGGTAGSYGAAANTDGSTLVGWTISPSGTQAFRWTAAGGMQGLGDLPGGSFYSSASAVSGDGTVIVGKSSSASGYEAFCWTAAGGMQGLGDLPGGSFSSGAVAMSSDGSVIVGFGSSASSGTYNEACRWTAAGGIEGLGDLPGENFSSLAWGVSGDGSLIVGAGNYVPGSGGDAFIWDADHGMRSLEDVLSSDYGLDLSGWTLKEADAISADGSTIVGWGINPSGQDEAFVATVPEPGSVSLVLAATGLLLRRRR